MCVLCDARDECFFLFWLFVLSKMFTSIDDVCEIMESNYIIVIAQVIEESNDSCVEKSITVPFTTMLPVSCFKKCVHRSSERTNVVSRVDTTSLVDLNWSLNSDR
jgi:hypothetical protein